MDLSEIPSLVTTNNAIPSIAKQRIRGDLNEINENISDSPIIYINEIDDDCFKLEAAISGPSSTAYENGVFLLEIKVSEQYPVSY